MKELDEYLIETYSRLKHPERMKELELIVQQTIIDLHIPENAEDLAKKAKLEYIKENISEAFYLSPDELLEKLSPPPKKGGGKKIDHEKLDLMLQAFLETDRHNGTSAMAIKLAYDRLNEKYSTIKGEAFSNAHISMCLKKIIFLTNIEKSDIGRPVNKYK